MINRQKLITNFPCFSQFTAEQVHELANLMQKISFSTNEIIVQENDLVDSVYLIAQGSAEVTQNGELIAALNPGEAIGLSNTGFYSTTGLRTATVIASAPVVALKLSLTKFDQFLQKYPQLNATMANAAKQMLKMRLLKRAAPFTELSSERIHWVMQHIETHTVKAGTVIFNEGDSADICYLVYKGSIEIFTINEDKTEYSLAQLKKSAIFGEVALLTDAPRNASARAVEDSTLLLLHKNDFLELMQQEKAATDTILQMMVDRARPIAKQNITIHYRQTDDNETIITLKNPEEGDYYQLSTEGLFIWQQLNGKQTLRDITTAFYKEFAAREPEAIYELIFDLVDNGFVINPTLQTQQTKTELSFWTKILLHIRNVMEIQWAVKNVDEKLSYLYEKGFRLFFTKPALWIMVSILILGIIAFSYTTSQIAMVVKVSHTIGIPHIGGLLLLAILVGNFTVIFHELAHAFTTKFYDRKVYHLGVGWYWITPIAFTDTSDMWLSDKRARTAVNFAGMFNDATFAGLSAIIGLFTIDPWLHVFFWFLSLMLLITVMKNLDPFLEFDGYYILMDLLDKPNLRESALVWLLHPHDWRAHKPELIYWLCCGLFIIVTAVVAYALQILFIGIFLPTHIFGISTSHLRWIVPTLAVIISSLGIFAEVKRRKALMGRS